MYVDFEGESAGNFNDIVTIYMVKYGVGDTATIMNDTSKSKLKEEFDNMCSYTTSSGSETTENEDGSTTSMCYCRDEKHLLSFLNRNFNEEDACEVRFDYDRCSTSCKEKLRLYGIDENGQRNKMVEHHYSHMEHQFKQGGRISTISMVRIIRLWSFCHQEICFLWI